MRCVLARLILCAALSLSACSAHFALPFWHAHARPIEAKDRPKIPATGPNLRFVPPLPQLRTLDNQLSVYVLTNRRVPMVSAHLVVRGAGSASDLAGQQGAASLLAEAAKLGTTTRSAHAIAAQMEGLGASLDTAVSADASTYSAQLLKNTLAEGLEVLVDVALHPALHADHVARAKQARLAELAGLQAQPSAVMQTIARKLVFGEQHPYAHVGLGTPKSVAALSAAALAAHHERTYAPRQTALIFVGDIDADEAHALAQRALGGWSNAAADKALAALYKAKAPLPLDEAGLPPSPPQAPAHTALVDRPGAPQAQCAVVGLGIARSAAEYPQLVLANAVLGGMFNSRINMNLREQKGWTYGARSNFDCLRGRGMFTVASAMRTDVAIDGVAEMLSEIENMRNTAISAEELRAAKNRHILSVAGNMEFLDQQGQSIAQLFVYELPLNTYQELPKTLEGIGESQVLEAARTFWPPEHLHVVVVGDRVKLEEKMSALRHGEVQLFDAAGDKLEAVHP